MDFELRFGANILTTVGFDSAAAPIGQTSKTVIMNAEIIGDGVNALNGRNLTALAATTIAVYNLTLEVTTGA